MDLNDTGNRVIGGIVVALLVIGAWYLGTAYKIPSGTKVADTKTDATTSMTDTSGTGETTQTTSSTDTSAEHTPVLPVSGSAVTVKDQPAGDTVTVESATLPQLGWIAVRDSDGRTLGAGRFDAGTVTNVQVPLLRATEPGQRYQVLLYVDDGDKAFDLHTDTLVTNADGSVAGATFTTLSGN